MTATLPDVPATVAFVQLTDSEGRLVLLPAATVAHFLTKGIASITMTIGLRPGRPAVEWLTVTEAARQHVDDVDGMTEAVAKTKIVRACDAGRLTSTGIRSRRRIEPTSLAAWRLAEREKGLGGTTGGPGSRPSVRPGRRQTTLPAGAARGVFETGRNDDAND